MFVQIYLTRIPHFAQLKTNLHACLHDRSIRCTQCRLTRPPIPRGRSVSAGTDLVAIDGSSGQLSVKDSIDRETIDTIYVTVTATDSGVPPKNNSIDVRLGRLTVFHRYRRPAGRTT